MSAKPHFTPPGYHTATPYLVVDGAARALEFYRQAFGATELLRMDTPAGKIGHAEMKIGDSIIMLADEAPEWDARGPLTIGGSPASLMLYVANADDTVNQAVAAGAKVVMPLKDQFYGDRSAMVLDPFGHKWTIATHQEDVAPDEMKRRMAALFAPK